MDWKECLGNRIVKNVKGDHHLIISIRAIAKVKIESAEALPNHLYIAKICLLYDALREYLESTALEKGYKIYNHECYVAFLKEILNLSREGDLFDKLRKIRNGINYYGISVTEEEALDVIKKLKELIKKFKQ